MRLENVTGVRYMYHDPCHSPMKKHDPLTVVNTLMNSAQNGVIAKNDRCCGESGTLAVTRAGCIDASALSQGAGSPRRRGPDPRRRSRRRGQDPHLLPLLLQGLKRFNDDADLDADYIGVEIAKHLLGADWLPDYVRKANKGGIERVLV